MGSLTFHFYHTLFLSIAAPRFDESPTTANVVLNSSNILGRAVFTCSVYAIPIATNIWQYRPLNGLLAPVNTTRANITTVSNGEKYTTLSTLTYFDVDFVDRGEFVCTATNIHDSISAAANLNVYGKCYNKMYLCY